ncbi:Hypothetical protein D9617_27g044690 [Elsinoe fawcettii]|nr:Hypothetical protein D9617_27g044690 [Elsinoe fawcettii]
MLCVNSNIYHHSESTMFRSINIFLLFALLFTVAFAAPNSKAACNPTQVDLVKKAFNQPKAFCNWYLSAKQTKSPLKALTRPQFSNACSCIANKKQSTTAAETVANPGAAPKCNATQKKTLQKEAKKTSEFCTFWNSAKWRSSSPFAKIKVRTVYNACKCFAKTNSTSSAVPRPSNSTSTSTASATTSHSSNGTALITSTSSGLPTTTGFLNVTSSVTMTSVSIVSSATTSSLPSSSITTTGGAGLIDGLFGTTSSGSSTATSSVESSTTSASVSTSSITTSQITTTTSAVTTTESATTSFATTTTRAAGLLGLT